MDQTVQAFVIGRRNRESRLLLLADLKDVSGLSLMINHMPVDVELIPRASHQVLLLASFPFAIVHARLIQNQKVLWQADEKDCLEAAASNGFFIDLTENKLEDDLLKVKGQVLSCWMEPVYLSLADGWQDLLAAKIQKQSAAGMEEQNENPLSFDLDHSDFEIDARLAPGTEAWLWAFDGYNSRSLYLGCSSLIPKKQSALQKAGKVLQGSGMKALFHQSLSKLQQQSELENYNGWLQAHLPSSLQLKQQEKTVFENPITFSIVCAAYNTPLEYFDQMIQSVIDQSYPYWQLCIADGSDNLELANHIQSRYNNEPRIVYEKLTANLGISGNMNQALKLASEDYIGFLDHDDLLTPNALFEMATCIHESENAADMIYSDEDKLDTSIGLYCQPHFKPDFSWDQLLGHNYICHFLVLSKALADEVGWFYPQMDGAQDYDYILRSALKARSIAHIPKILYHWRIHSASTASSMETKSYALDAGSNALQQCLNHLGLSAKVHQRPAPYHGMYWLQPLFPKETNPALTVDSILEKGIQTETGEGTDIESRTEIEGRVEFKDRAETEDRTETKNISFTRAVNGPIAASAAEKISIITLHSNNNDSLLKMADWLYGQSWPNWELIILDVDSQKDTEEIADDLKNKPGIRILEKDEGTGLAEILNDAAQAATGTYLFFLSPSFLSASRHSLEQLVFYAGLPHRGALSCKIVDGHHQVLCQGQVLDGTGRISNAFAHLDESHPGYMGKALTSSSASLLPLDVFFVKTSDFMEAGGFHTDMEAGRIAQDLLLRMLAAGKIHGVLGDVIFGMEKMKGFENALPNTDKGQKVFVQRWKPFLNLCDPFYNPNFEPYTRPYTLPGDQ